MSYVVPVPMSLAVLTSLFGSRVHPVSGQVKDHGGVDFGVGAGTPVYAAANGTVSQFWDTGGGNVAYVNHDDGRRTAYLHLSSYSVPNGSRVAAGQEIGRSGNTGSSTTGAHLHFEVRNPRSPKDERLNPLDFLPGTFELAPKLAQELGRRTVTGGGTASLGLLLLVGAGLVIYKKRTGRYPWQRR